MSKKSLFELRASLEEVMNDVERRAKYVLDKYKDNLPKVPKNFKEAKSYGNVYNAYVECLNAMDELTEVRVRIGLVINQVQDILNEGYPRELSFDQRLVRQFYDWIKGKQDILKSYEDILNGVMWGIKDKIKLLQGINYWEEN